MVRGMMSLLALIALLLAPAGMIGRAEAATPHDSMSMPADHCAGMGAIDDQDGSAPAIDCFTACAAIPPIAPPIPAEPAFRQAAPALVALGRLAGTRPEAETPPPRAS